MGGDHGAANMVTTEPGIKFCDFNRPKDQLLGVLQVLSNCGGGVETTQTRRFLLPLKRALAG